MKEIKITVQEENQRLDKFLMKYLNTAPKSFIYKMLRKKRIKLNTGRAEGSEILILDDTIQLYLAEETMDQFMEEKTVAFSKRHFGIVYEDDQVLFVSKPAGVLTHPEKAEDQDTLIDQILSYLMEKGDYLPSKETSFTPAVCNRLDRNTSGIVLAGKTLAAVQALNEAIAQKKIDKIYLTMVKGSMTSPKEFTGWLQKNSVQNQVKIFMEERPDSKKIVTRVRPVAQADGYTLLEIILVTGKSHQIRAQLSQAGYPIVGDRKYGDPRTNQIFKEKYALNNQFLHASKLIWKQDDGKLKYLIEKEFLAPLPKALQTIYWEFFNKSEG